MTGESASNAASLDQSRMGYALLGDEGEIAVACASLQRMTAPWQGVDGWWLEIASRIVLPAPTQCPVCALGQRLGALEMSLPPPEGVAPGRRVFQLEFVGHAHNLEQTPPREMLLVRDITEERRRSEAARREVGQYESICRFMREVYFRTDTQGAIQFISPSCEKLLHYRPEELLTRPLGKICAAPEHADEFLEIMLESKSVRDFELVMRCVKGEQIPVNINADLMTAAHGGPPTIEGILRDLSERERLDTLLVRQTRQFQDALVVLEQLEHATNQHALVLVTDAEGYIVKVNDRLLQLSLYDASEVLGRNPRLFNSGFHPEAFFQELWSRIASGNTWRGEIRNRKKNGDFFWLDCTITPTMTPMGKPTRHLAVSTDITERVRTGLRLERNRDYLHRIIDSMGDGVFVLDAKGRLLSINREGERLLGWRESELAHRNLHEAIHHTRPDGTPFPAEGCPVHQSLLGRIFRVDDDHFIHKDGTFLPVSHTTAPLREGGRIIGSVAVFRDNTQSIKRHQDLEQTRNSAMASSRMKSEFLASMSHEIRTPMNAIIGMNDLLMDTALNDEQHEFAEIIRDSATSLLSLINDILDFSKIEADKIDIEEIDFNLVTVVEGSAELLAPQALEKGISLVTYISPRIPGFLRGDPGRLRQMLLNLIGNAIKFTEEGEVVVRAQMEAEAVDRVTVRFSVTDTGIGLPPNNRERLFEPFTQASRDTTRKYGGTGLGLAICKRLVELMDGSIGAESGDGEGTTFWLRIPLWIGEPVKETETKPLNTAPLRDLRILTVVERASDHEILGKYFRSWGMFHRGVLGGEQGLSILRQTASGGDPFDLMLVGSALTDVNALTYAEELLGGDLLRGAHLIALLDGEDRETRELMLDAGYAACLSKPFRQATLVSALIELANPGKAAPPVEAITVATPAGREPPKVEPDAYEALESGKLLLLVEDNPVNQKVTLLQLKKMGYAAHAVNNGKEAVEAVSHLPYAMILMDCQMPVMDGFEATHAIRQMDRANARHIPIVAMTANAMKGDRERCLKAGMDDYLSKPVAPDTLKKMLNYWIPKGAGEMPPIEIHQLRQLFGDDDDMIRELLHHFQPSVRELLDKLWQSVQDRDEELLADAAFELKEACSNMGATGMAHLARTLEQAVVGENWDKAREMMEGLERIFQRVGVFIGEF